ncbi:MAG: MarR family winged helix-turn-helix transcriptional regulator [Gammaproteobacteria bacterium]|jgi:DNA-binding MarR family transcriptional regulator|nr:MarR family transcriptional regulator [Gammaproteobacteria bacterium]
MEHDSMKDIFMDLRRIMRAMDVYSRQLSDSHGLTGPQMLCMREISQQGSLTTGTLALAVALSPATLTGILDRLEMRGLVSRERRPEDKRRVVVSLTTHGKQMSQELPSPIQERFGAKLAELPAEEQASIRRALGNVARMMEEDSYGTSPKTRKR